MSKKVTLNPFSAAILARRLPYALVSVLVPGLAVAGPTGGAVVAGQASITPPNGTTTTINQSSQNAIINWQQFNVGTNEYVVFNQPNASAAVLNRVVGGSPSDILGSISANGRVFLINPQGIMFGQGARIDVGGLVASTMDISNQDFMSGRYVFTNGSTGTVSNAGNINAANNGFVVLAGDYVKNTGVIQAKLGDVVLASGSAMTLDMNGDGLINFSVDQAALSNRAGVDNLGTLAAQGGTVIMTAKVAHTLTNTAVNNSGQISAKGITEDGGDIYLTADGGDAINSGSIDVSGQNNHNAGSVRINSDHDITLAAGSNIIATGADGGDVRVVADNDLSVEHGAHTTVARQSTTGKGGFAEYSGHNSVMIRDIVDLGENGNLLVDPTDITIGYGGATSGYDQATIENQLRNMSTSSTFTIDASGSGTDAGNIHVLGNLQGNTLDGQGYSSGYGGSLVMQAGPGGSITFDDQTTTFQIDGDIIIHGGGSGGTQTLGNLQSGHAITIDGYGSISTGYLHAATGIDVTSSNGGVSFTNMVVVNTNGGGPVKDTDIHANVTASGGKISGDFIYIDNSYVPANGSYGNGTAATLELTSSSDIIISGSNGNNQTAINVIGGGGRGTGDSIDTTASATLTAGGNIQINNASNATGAIVISGYDYHYPDVDSETGLGEEIHSGGADLTLEGNTVTVGQTIQVHGEGLANVDIKGHNGITVGKLDVVATAATEDDLESFADTYQEYGYATISLFADQGNSNAIPTTSAIKTGNILAQGPNAIITAVGGTVELGNTANTSDDYGVSADANTIRGSISVTDHNNGDSVLYSSNAGSALISVVAGGHDAQGRSIVTHGGVVLDGPSSQLNLLSAGDVSVDGSLLVTGEGANYSGDASQTPFSQSPLSGIGFFSNDTPFLPSDGDMTWGSAQLLIAGAPSSTSNLSDTAHAGHVGINGDLTVRGVGLAKAAVSASNLDVGDVSIGAAAASMQGTFTSQETINGNNYTVTHEVGSTLIDGEGTPPSFFVSNTPATYGLADFELNLNASTGTTTIASLDVRGDNGSGSVSINGGNNVTVNGSVNVGQTSETNAPSYAEVVSYADATTQQTVDVVSTESAPTIAGHSVGVVGDSNVFSVGFDTALSGKFTSGDITVNGTGLTGVAVKANAIQVNGNITVNGYRGSVAYIDDSGTETDTPFNDTVFALNATGGTATVAGAINVTGQGNLHVGGKMNAGAHSVVLNAQNGSIDSTIPGDLIAFNHPLSGGQFPLASESDVILPALDITGSDIYLDFNADSTLTGLKLNGSGLVSIDGDAGVDGTAISHLLRVGASPSITSGTGDLTIANTDVEGTGTATLTSTGGNITIHNSSFSGSTAALNFTANAHGDFTMTDGHIGPVVLTTVPIGGSGGTVSITSTIPAGNVSLSAGGDVTVRTNIKANRLIMNAGGSLYLGGTSATAGDTSLNGASGVFDDSSEQETSSFMLTANSLGVTSPQGQIDFTNSSLSVGSGLAKDVTGALLGKDTAMTSHLDVFAPVSTSPNAAFVAGGTTDNPQSPSVILGDLTLSGDYLYVKAESVGFGSLAHTGTGPLFYNFVPRSPGTGIDASGIADLINNFNGISTDAILARSGSLTNTANLTVAFGSSSQTGQIVAGPVDVSGTNTNLVYVTTGTITGPGSVHTGGHVVLLQGGVLTVDGVVQGQTNQPPPNIDPATAEKALDASGAAADVAGGGNPNDKGGPGDNDGDPLTGQQDPIETHTNDGITATSCI